MPKLNIEKKTPKEIFEFLKTKINKNSDVIEIIDNYRPKPDIIGRKIKDGTCKRSFSPNQRKLLKKYEKGADLFYNYANENDLITFF
jgi:hypothetical protein